MKHIAKSRKGSVSHFADQTKSLSTTPIMESYDVSPDTPTIDMDNAIIIPYNSE